MTQPAESIGLRMPQLIAVSGITGKQGGAVARHLLAAGFRVRGLTRSITSDRARRLATQGVEMVLCDLNQPTSIPAAVEGACGVFSVQNYYEKGVGYAGEIRQGCALADAAKAAGVQHFVQSTMATASGSEFVHHFQSKFEIERHIDRIGLPHTFLGTVWFMDNLFDPSLGGETNIAVIAGTLGRNRPFEMLAIDDLGAIAAQVFRAPERFMGRKIDIASDRKTIDEVRADFLHVIGRSPPRYRLPNALMRMLHSDFAAQLRWQKRYGWSFPLEAAREIHPGMQDLVTFLRANRACFT